MTYTVASIRTTSGTRYILLKNGKASLSHRTYYKKKSNAISLAKRLNPIKRKRMVKADKTTEAAAVIGAIFDAF